MSKASAHQIPLDEIRNELENISLSRIFARSLRLKEFLNFVVEHTLRSKPSEIKEYLIGTEVYGRSSDYDPGKDSIVRSEARRLRSKLNEYYAGEGSSSTIEIRFQSGSYVPAFVRRELESLETCDAARTSDIRVEVRPFSFSSGDETASEFANGIPEEIGHRLAQEPRLRVFMPGHEAADIVIEGSVHVESESLFVTIRVVNVGSFEIWSKKFQARIFPQGRRKLQEDNAASLVNRTVSAILLSKEPHPSAADLYPKLLAAEALLDDGPQSDVAKAAALFREILDVYPQYLRGAVGLAQCYLSLSLAGWSEGRKHIDWMQQTFLRGTQADPPCKSSFAGLASSLGLQLKWGEAEEAFREALRYTYNHVSLRQFAVFLSVRSRFDQAMDLLQEARNLDPFSSRQKTAWAAFYFYSRRFEEGLDYFLRPLTHGEFPDTALVFKAFIEAQLGRFLEANQTMTSLLSRPAAGKHLHIAHATILAVSGQSDSAQALIDKYGLLDESYGISCFRKAQLCAALQRHDEAIKLLTQSWNNLEAELPWVSVEPHFDGLRGRQEFKELLARLG